MMWSSGIAAAPTDSACEVELSEGGEYRYSWEDVQAEVSSLIADPEEIFQPDTIEGKSGRLSDPRRRAVCT